MVLFSENLGTFIYLFVRNLGTSIGDILFAIKKLGLISGAVEIYTSAFQGISQESRETT